MPASTWWTPERGELGAGVGPPGTAGTGGGGAGDHRLAPRGGGRLADHGATAPQRPLSPPPAGGPAGRKQPVDSAPRGDPHGRRRAALARLRRDGLERLADRRAGRPRRMRAAVVPSRRLGAAPGRGRLLDGAPGLERQLPALRGAAPPHRPPRRRYGADHRRARHRQGARRLEPSLPEPALAPPLRPGAGLGPAGDPLHRGAVRARARLLPAPRRAASGASWRPTGAPCSSTRWPTCPSPSSRSSCAWSSEAR